MKALEKKDTLEVQDGKIVRTFTEKTELNEDDIVGEINSCISRIENAQEIIDREKVKLANLKKIQKDLKL